MGEFWIGSQFWVTKEAASASSIYGKTLVAAESFTGWHNWQDGPAAYKRLFDIALFVKAGANQLEIQVANSWNNRIVGDLNRAPEDRVTRTNVTSRFNENTPLMPSGLLGPVKLRFPAAASCEL